MTKVKICGLSTKVAVDVAVAHGADFIGFVFAKSARKISPERAREISVDVPPRVKKVGVFVSPTLAFLSEVVRIAELDLIQIHGDVPEGKLPRPLILATKKPVEEEGRADFILVDAPSDGEKFAGGNGKIFPWAETFPKPQLLPREKLFVAGGLNADNVKQAIAYFRPFSVDVSSGVETNGQKDVKKMIAFLAAAKEEK